MTCGWSVTCAPFRVGRCSHCFTATSHFHGVARATWRSTMSDPAVPDLAHPPNAPARGPSSTAGPGARRGSRWGWWVVAVIAIGAMGWYLRSRRPERSASLAGGSASGDQTERAASDGGGGGGGGRGAGRRGGGGDSGDGEGRVV